MDGSARKIKRTQYRYAPSALWYYQRYVLQETLAACMLKDMVAMQHVHCESVHQSVHYVPPICYLRSTALQIALSMIRKGSNVVVISASA